MRTLQIDRNIALILLIAVSLITVGSRAAAQSTVPAELEVFTAAGATVLMLASAEFGTEPDANQSLTLSRVVPGPSDALPVIIAGGPELWFVESGTVMLTGDSGSSLSISAGEQAVLADKGQYTVSFQGNDCPSALRLELTPIIAMKIGTDKEAPELGPDGRICPASGLLFEATDSVGPRPIPALAFIARVTWNAETYVSPATMSGPIGYAVESGSLQLNGPEMINLGLSAGAWATVAGGQQHWIFVPGTQPATALVAGAFATNSTLPTPVPTATPVVGVIGSNYVSPTFGYSLSWDETWSVVSDSSVNGEDSVQLTNQTSNVYIQGFGNYPDDAIVCLDGLAARLPTTQGFSEVEPRLTVDGKPILSGDASRRMGVYDFTYTTESASRRYTEYLECRVIEPGWSVMVVTQIVLADAYPSQIEPLRQLLDGIVMPTHT